MPAEIIFFEGSDYVGKGTQISKLYDYLFSLGKDVYIIKEPGSTDGMQCIRERLLDKDMNKKEPLNYLTRRLLYAADHAQAIGFIKEIRNKYDYILVDRYTLMSDLIYGPLHNSDEHFGHAMDISRQITKCYEGFYGMIGSCPIENAKLVLLSITEKTLFEREAKRNNSSYNDSNIFDETSFDFKIKINELYNGLADIIEDKSIGYTSFGWLLKHFDKKFVINANKTEDEVFENIVKKLNLVED